MGCEATSLPEPAFCISDGGGSIARRDPPAAHGFAEAGVSQVAAPFLPPVSTDLLLPNFLALYPTAAAVLWLPLPLPSAPALFSWSLFSAAPGSASSSSGMWKRHFPHSSLAALLTWKHVSPLVLLHPGPALSQQLVLPTAMLQTAVGPRPLPHRPLGPRDLREQSKSHQALWSPPRGAGALLPLTLLFNFLFPNQKWPKQRDSEVST